MWVPLRPGSGAAGSTGTLGSMSDQEPLSPPARDHHRARPRSRPRPGPDRARPRPDRVRQGDREKAYRPLPLEARRAALADGLACWERGDFFAAHEALEPAWMGTDDLAERGLHQGLIKVAAAYVHAVRGNPAGLAKNLAGARRHLAQGVAAGPAWGLDVQGLLAAVDDRLADPSLAVVPPVIRRIPSA